MNVLIFKVNQLGDNVVFLPVVQMLRRLRPQWKINILTSPLAGPLYAADVPDGSRIAVPTMEFRSLWKRPGNFLTLLSRIRKMRPDVCLITNDQGYVAHWLARFSGAKIRISNYAPFLKRLPKLTATVPTPRDMRAAVIGWELGRVLFAHTGADDWPEFPPAPDLSHLSGGQQPVPRRVVIHPGASRAYQRWPIERHAELAARLAGQFDVHWIESAEILKHLDLPGVTRHRPADLAALVRLIASAELFIGNNSGPMHLAFALGRPTVVVNGPTMRVWDPCWHPERMLMLRDRTLPCLPCDSYHGPVETCKNAAAALTCLLRWTTDEVERACRQWLDRWATPRTH